MTITTTTILSVLSSLTDQQLEQVIAAANDDMKRRRAADEILDNMAGLVTARAQIVCRANGLRAEIISGPYTGIAFCIERDQLRLASRLGSTIVGAQFCPDDQFCRLVEAPAEVQ